MTAPQNSAMITGSKSMQMVADDPSRVSGIQMTAAQQCELRVPLGQRHSNGRLWDNTLPSAVAAFMTANFSFVQSY